MKVLKRDGSYEECHFDTITARLKELCYELSDTVSAAMVAQKICMSIYDGIPTSKLDELASEVAIAMVTEHPDYGRLAGRIVVSDLHKQTVSDLVQVFTILHKHTVKGKQAPLVTNELLQVVKDNAEALNGAIDYNKDYEYDYFGMKTLIRSYLTKMNGKVIERPQTMLMRVSIGLWGADITRVLETYSLLSDKYYTHATPTLYNAGTPRPQLSSCFLLGVKSDSVDGIFDTLKQCANISKYAGGIGLHVHNIRARGSFIRGTNGQSSGILPLLRTVNNVARYIDQGGRRPGSIAVYLSPDHPDFADFTSAKLPNGSFEERAYDLFYGAYIPDLFMKRVDEDAQWSMFCPSEAPGLADVVGREYEELYTRYEKEGLAMRTVPARTVWQDILRSQVETGGPYLVYKDACNLKSNQQMLGVIKSSNLCVRGSTLIMTDRGYRRIDTLVGDDTIKVWNGEEFSEVEVRLTGKKQDLVRVKVSTGARLDCTYYHKFYVEGDEQPVHAIDLKPGQVLQDAGLPVIERGKPDRKSYEQGWQAGEGERRADKDTKPTFTVPLNLDLKSRLTWFEGLVDSSGMIRRTQNRASQELVLPATDEAFLRQVQLLLQTMGCGSVVQDECLTVPGAELEMLMELDFSPRRQRLYTLGKNTDDDELLQTREVKVVSVEELGTKEDTYCFNEPKKHKALFNGIYCGNCTEIVEYSDPENVAVCNLASIALPKFVDAQKQTFDFEQLHSITKTVTRNTDRVIDRTFYPVPEASNSNLKHRPIGLGVQGLADVLAQLKMAWDSRQAAELNKLIFATIYHAAVEASVEMAEEAGPYSSFEGSPASKGLLQPDLWGVKNPVGPWDWENLKERVKAKGMRNSLLVAPMPTASTSQIMGNCECVEPMNSVVFKRSTSSGEFVVINKHFINEMIGRKLWSKQVKDKIIAADGSVQNIPEVPADLKPVYRTAWEIKQRVLIDLAAGRGPYVDQSQSLNLFVERPTITKLHNMHFHAWRSGLKTGCYYLRSKAATSALKFTIDPKLESSASLSKAAVNEPEACDMCSS